MLKLGDKIKLIGTRWSPNWIGAELVVAVEYRPGDNFRFKCLTDVAAGYTKGYVVEIWPSALTEDTYLKLSSIKRKSYWDDLKPNCPK